MKDLILETIIDFLKTSPTDTIWITDTETMLERLEYLYYQAGGTEAELEERIINI